MKRRIALLAAVLLAAAGGAAYATIPDSSGVIHACYLNRVGTVRVIDPSAGQRCSSLETPLDWSQQGPAGPAGPKGDKGDEGDGLVWKGQYDGTKSYAVNDAVQWNGSSYGATAPLTGSSCGAQACIDPNAPGTNSSWQLLAQAGDKGAVGETGPQGPQGPAGPQGLAGPAGPQGSAATALWAAVAANGTLVAGSNVTATTKINATPQGSYLVTFDRDVSSCAWVATPRKYDGEISVTQETAVSPDPKAVWVVTWRGYDVFGSNAMRDAGFSLAVFC